MKSGVGTPSSLRFGAAFFLATVMPDGPAPDLLAIGCGTTLAVALATTAAYYYLATHGVGTPTHAVAPAKRNWFLACWTGSFAAGTMAHATAYSAAAPGDQTRTKDLPEHGGEAKANRPSAATCSATALEGAT